MLMNGHLPEEKILAFLRAGAVRGVLVVAGLWIPAAALGEQPSHVHQPEGSQDANHFLAGLTASDGRPVRLDRLQHRGALPAHHRSIGSSVRHRMAEASWARRKFEGCPSRSAAPPLHCPAGARPHMQEPGCLRGSAQRIGYPGRTPPRPTTNTTHRHRT